MTNDNDEISRKGMAWPIAALSDPLYISVLNDPEVQRAMEDRRKSVDKPNPVVRPAGILYGSSEIIYTEDGTRIVRPFPRESGK